jgi:hypothetical protein
MEQIDPSITVLLRDLYRLGRVDEDVAVRLFQNLLRMGYRYEDHREAVSILEARSPRRRR